VRHIRHSFANQEVPLSDYEHLVAGMPGDDPDDHRHAAAAVARAPATIVTANLADFPAEPLAALGVSVVGPDDYPPWVRAGLKVWSDLSESATRFVTGSPRLAATGGAHWDGSAPLFSQFQCFLIYLAGTQPTHCDSSTVLRIRRLGVRIPPSARKCWSQACDAAFESIHPKFVWGHPSSALSFLSDQIVTTRRVGSRARRSSGSDVTAC
jgi:hypothetical protein